MNMNFRDGVSLISFIILLITNIMSAALLSQESEFFDDLRSINPQFRPTTIGAAEDPCSWREVVCEIDSDNTSAVLEL